MLIPARQQTTALQPLPMSLDSGPYQSLSGAIPAELPQPKAEPAMPKFLQEQQTNYQEGQASSQLGREQLYTGLRSLGALGLAAATDALPAPKQAASQALIPTDVRAWAKVGLGLYATQQFNQLTGIQLPTWGLALENAAVIHGLMMGLNRRSVVSFGLMLPIILGSVGLMHLAHHGVDSYLDRHPDLPRKGRTALEIATKAAVTLTAIGAGLTIFPRLHLSAAKRGWFGKSPQALKLQENALNFFRQMKGTKEAEAFLNSSAEASHGMATHHRDAIHLIKRRLQELKAGGANRLLEEHPETKRLWEAIQARVPKLGNTVREDYEHLGALKALKEEVSEPLDALLQKHNSGLLNTSLKNLLNAAEHQLGHAPKPKSEALKAHPFFQLLDTSGKTSAAANQGLATFTCANGCCTGSLLCLADVADLFTTLWTNLKHIGHPKDTQSSVELDRTS